MPCNASYTRFIFEKVFYMYCKLICILYALLCWQNFILVKSGCYTRAQEVAPSASRKGGQTEAAMAKPMSTSPPITVDRVDKMYHQLAEIHAITDVQLAECACWRQSDPTPSPVRVGTGQQRLTVKPSVARLAPSPPTDFLSGALLWRQA
jgi:hypothetical protein